jgi:nicotinamide-nucleotide amidase
VTGVLLKGRNKTMCTAESCTGGYIAHQVTSVPGSSAYYTGSIICYDNRIKVQELGVKEDTLKTAGAVSKACVTEMAEGARRKFGTDYAISVSGIAGPDGGTAEKPVGTVWIAISSKTGTAAQLFNFGDHRGRTIERAALQALDMLRRRLLEE